MSIFEKIKPKIFRIIELLPIQDKNKFRFNLRQIYLKFILSIYSMYPFSKLSNYFLFSLSDKYQNYENIYNLVGYLKKKKDVKTILEIGIGGHNKMFSGGYSLMALSFYYKNASIIGLDINDKKFLDSKKIKTYQGSQSDIKILEKISHENNNFDIIIDDGSHFVDHQLFSFNYLWKFLNEDGLYIIEDISGSYLRRLRGSPELDDKKNLVSYFSNLNHLVNSDTLLKKWIDKSLSFVDISEVYYFKNVIIIKKNKKKNIKGLSIEESNAAFNIEKNHEGSLNIKNDFD